MKLSLGYMTRLQEMQVLTRQATTDIIAEIQPVVTREETHYVKTHFREVEVGTDVRNYLMDLVENQATSYWSLTYSFVSISDLKKLTVTTEGVSQTLEYFREEKEDGTDTER